MLSPIPRSILRDTLTLFVPQAFDQYQKPASVKTFTVNNVHLQIDNTTIKRSDNSEVTLRGVLFVDARLSCPRLDYQELQEAVQAAGGVMTCKVTDRRGRSGKEMTILTVDGLPDDEDNIHHWELGVV